MGGQIPLRKGEVVCADLFGFVLILRRLINFKTSNKLTARLKHDFYMPMRSQKY